MEMNIKMKKGFTLVEVLVSVAIIVALVTVIMYAPTSARKKAAFTRASIEAEQIATGALLYYQTTGSWAPDVLTLGEDAAFYTPQYIDITGTSPSSYLGSGYKWDWQNWEFPNSAGFQCWQSVDLYRESGPNKTLVMRDCIRNVCQKQKFCDGQASPICYDTATNRDNGTPPTYPLGNTYSPACEECGDEAECANKYRK